MKIDEMIKCPHCGEIRSYVFHDNFNMLECHNCDKPFDIKLKTEIVVIATLPKRNCCICDFEFIANSDEEDENICPQCGFKGWHYKKS